MHASFNANHFAKQLASAIVAEHKNAELIEIEFTDTPEEHLTASLYAVMDSDGEEIELSIELKNTVATMLSEVQNNSAALKEELDWMGGDDVYQLYIVRFTS